MRTFDGLLYQLHLADQTITQVFEKQLGISLTRYQMLQFLLRKAPCSQMLLKEQLKIDPAALTRHFKILETSGYVTRSRNPANQREVLVDVTDHARELLLRNPSLEHLAIKKEMEAILTFKEQEQLSHLLEKLVSGLETLSF